MIFSMIIKLSHIAPEVRSSFTNYKYEWYCIKFCYNSRKKRLKPAFEDSR